MEFCLPVLVAVLWLSSLGFPAAAKTVDWGQADLDRAQWDRAVVDLRSGKTAGGDSVGHMPPGWWWTKAKKWPTPGWYQGKKTGWTHAPTVVPLPGGLVCLTSGLALLGLMGWGQHRSTG